LRPTTPPQARRESSNRAQTDNRRNHMKNKVLKDIIDYARHRLVAEYGTCGVLDNDEMAILNSSDNKRGNDIIIKITEKPE
ncbi:hypothetical protein LCGC14_1927610, partial [marine sediment metagenome]